MYQGINVFIDGTFKCVPHPYYQLIVVMVYDTPLNLYIPVYYILTTSKTQWSYWSVLQEVMVNCEFKFNPSVIHCDYELALINAIGELFEGTAVVGCLFHFKQAILRKMKKLSIPDEETSIAMKKGALDVLTIIPPGEIEGKGLSYVKSLLPKTEKWDRFFAYFNKTWLTRYEVSTWNIYGLVGVQNRTNNPLERLNREINDAFPTAHPNLMNFVDTIKKQSFKSVNTIELVKLCKEKPPAHNIGFNSDIPTSYQDFVYLASKKV